jgi:hypothetical protein
MVLVCKKELFYALLLCVCSMQAEAQPVNEIPKYTFLTIGCAQFQLIVFLNLLSPN